MRRASVRLQVAEGEWAMLASSFKLIHEPVEQQRQDVFGYSERFVQMMLAGEDCDKASLGHGPFGSQQNPIPVNGARGEIKYLGQLRGKTGQALFFHRLCHTSSLAADDPVDVYEVVCMDGTQWNTLYFDMYHPRRSNLAPAGYEFVSFEKGLMDFPFPFGVNTVVEDFPYGLPAALVKVYGNHPGRTLTRRAQEWLRHHTFEKPQEMTAKPTDCHGHKPGQDQIQPDQDRLFKQIFLGQREAKRPRHTVDRIMSPLWARSTQERRNQRAEQIYRNLAKSGKPCYSLLLRSFDGTSREHRTCELLLTKYLDEEAPLISLANPSQMQPAGAAYLRFAEDMWQSAFRVLARNALLIFILSPPHYMGQVGPVYHDQNGKLHQEWLKWELRQIFVKHLLGRSIMVDSPPSLMVRDIERFNLNKINIKALIDYYRAFGKNLPEPSRMQVLAWKMLCDETTRRRYSI